MSLQCFKSWQTQSGSTWLDLWSILDYSSSPSFPWKQLTLSIPVWSQQLWKPLSVRESDGKMSSEVTQPSSSSCLEWLSSSRFPLLTKVVRSSSNSSPLPHSLQLFTLTKDHKHPDVCWHRVLSACGPPEFWTDLKIMVRVHRNLKKRNKAIVKAVGYYSC